MREQESVEVTAGHAARATRERLVRLDFFLYFMRSDTTPRPNDPHGGSVQLPFFRRPDGSVTGICRP